MIDSTEEQYRKNAKRFIFPTTVVEETCLLTEAVGPVRVKDVQGKEYIDFTSAICVANIGYSNSVVQEAINQESKILQAHIPADYAFLNRIKLQNGKHFDVSWVDLAKKLIEVTDAVMPFEKIIMPGVLGAETLIAALKIIKIKRLMEEHLWTTDKITDKFLHKTVFSPQLHDPFRFSFLAFKNAFHGRYGDAQLLTDSKGVQMWGLSSSCEVGRLTLPNAKQSLDDMIIETEEVISSLECFEPGHLIAFVFEPIQGEGGVYEPDWVKMKLLINSLRVRGIVIVADEIQTGLGRTGKMFACEHYGIEPDIIVLSKSLGGGMPIGAVVAKREMFKDILELGMHSGTFHWTPVACAAAIANLEVVEANIRNAADMGQYAMSQLKEIAQKHSIIREVRGRGLMIGIEFENKETRDRTVAFAQNDFNPGLLLNKIKDNIIRFYPPIVIQKPELDKALEIFEKSLRKL